MNSTSTSNHIGRQTRQSKVVSRNRHRAATGPAQAHDHRLLNTKAESRAEIGEKFAKALKEEERLKRELSALAGLRRQLTIQFVQAFLPSGITVIDLVIESCDQCGLAHVGTECFN